MARISSLFQPFWTDPLYETGLICFKLQATLYVDVKHPLPPIKVSISLIFTVLNLQGYEKFKRNQGNGHAPPIFAGACKATGAQSRAQRTGCGRLSKVKDRIASFGFLRSGLCIALPVLGALQDHTACGASRIRSECPPRC